MRFDFNGTELFDGDVTATSLTDALLHATAIAKDLHGTVILYRIQLPNQQNNAAFLPLATTGEVQPSWITHIKTTGVGVPRDRLPGYAAKTICDV